MPAHSVLKSILMTLALVCGFAQAAEVIVSLPDGRKVKLMANKTWDFVKPGDAAAGDTNKEELALHIERIFPETRSCKLGLKLKNHSNYFVKSLVPSFSAMLEGDTLYERKSVEFTRIRPQRDEYKEIRFAGLACDEISWIKVHGGERCTMDDLDKFSATKGECIARVKVIPSDKLSWRKQYP